MYTIGDFLNSHNIKKEWSSGATAGTVADNVPLVIEVGSDNIDKGSMRIYRKELTVSAAL